MFICKPALHCRYQSWGTSYRGRHSIKKSKYGCCIIRTALLNPGRAFLPNIANLLQSLQLRNSLRSRTALFFRRYLAPNYRQLCFANARQLLFPGAAAGSWIIRYFLSFFIFGKYTLGDSFRTLPRLNLVKTKVSETRLCASDRGPQLWKVSLGFYPARFGRD